MTGSPVVHALVTLGVWSAPGQWVPVPYVSSAAAGRLYCVIDPLVCLRCHGVMSVVAFITEARVIRRILDHLGDSARRSPRGRAAMKTGIGPVATDSPPSSVSRHATVIFIADDERRGSCPLSL